MLGNSVTESGEEQHSAAYYRAASARAGRLEAEATTQKVKQYLRQLMGQYDRLAEQSKGHPTL